MIRRMLETLRGMGVNGFTTAARGEAERRAEPALHVPAGVWMHHMTPTQMELMQAPQQK
jgi:hypothetical protein